MKFNYLTLSYKLRDFPIQIAEIVQLTNRHRALELETFKAEFETFSHSTPAGKAVFDSSLKLAKLDNDRNVELHR